MKDYLNIEVNTQDQELISVIDELPLWSAPFGLKLLDMIKLRKNIKALDVGCGFGFPLIELAQRLGHTSKVYGIDPWNEALERVKLKLKVYNIQNVILSNSSAENIPFENEYFDLIVSNNGINNVKDITQSLNECYRVSKPNSQFLFSMNTEETMREFYSVFSEVLKENNMTEEIKKMKAQIYSKRKPVDKIKNYVEDAGFKVHEIVHDSFELIYMDGSTMLNHTLIKYWFLDGWKNIIQINEQESIFEEVELKLNAVSETHGKFTLSVPFVVFNCIKL